MVRPPPTSLPYFYGEQYFIRKLDLGGVWSKDRPTPAAGSACTMGVTMPDEVRERIRLAIIAGDLCDATMGKTQAGGTETWREAFERFFGFPLNPADLDPPQEIVE